MARSFSFRAILFLLSYFLRFAAIPTVDYVRCCALILTISSTHLIFVCCFEYKIIETDFLFVVDFPTRKRYISWLIYCSHQQQQQRMIQVLVPPNYSQSALVQLTFRANANRPCAMCACVLWVYWGPLLFRCAFTICRFAYTFYKYVFDLPCDFWAR